MDLYVPPTAHMVPQPRTCEASSSSSRDPNTRKASVQSLPKAPASLFAHRNGRRYHGDESIPYLLPCDVQELSRQSLFHEIQREVYGGCHCAEFPDNAIPTKVLEIGCGTAIWSASVADSFASRGRPDVQFVGLDIVPVYPEGMHGVNFTFVRHNFQNLPLPFPDDEFDYVFCREISMATPATSSDIYGSQIADCVRVLRPGGILELQCSDYSIRSLQRTTAPYTSRSSAYTMTSATQFSMSAENPFVAAWNERITRALSKCQLSPVPCTLAGPQLLMEEGMVGLHTKRVALPLDEIWWEGAPSAEDRRKKRTSVESTESSGNRKNSFSVNRRSSTSVRSNLSHVQSNSPLSKEEKAVRELARLTFVQLIQSLEPVLREANNIAGDDWDRWYKDLMINFFQHGGLTGGECVEFGSWWGQKALRE